jgi:hypothetical protein
VGRNTMARNQRRSVCLRLLSIVIFTQFGGCGLYTPAKDPFKSDTPTKEYAATDQGNYENRLVNHITCEISEGLHQSKRLQVPWLDRWGTTVTLTITTEDQSGVAPGITTINPLQNVVFSFPSGGNVTAAQSFSFSAGATASANALRTETIQFTLRNRELLSLGSSVCKRTPGLLIDGDLKIRQFIYDKATIASLGNATLGEDRPPFNTWTEELTFVAAYGGSLTPTWKLARITANTASNLVVAERTNTNDLIVTLGPLSDKPLAPGYPLELTQSAMNQHNARVNASAIAVSVQGQSH